MVEIWVGKRTQDLCKERVAYGATVNRVRVLTKLTLGAKGILSRLVAMYRIPNVHPLASLTPVSRARSGD